jgi:hemerythrin-like domain-containing protein
MPNAITMLKSDHATLKRLLRELNEATAPKQRETLVATLEREVKTHSQIEEEVFYPAFKSAAEKSESEHLFYEAAEEHHIVDMVLPALKAANPKSHEFEAKASVLKELIEHHIKEEETEMFTAARQLIGEEQLREIGDLMQTRREAIEAMWDHPILRQVKKAQSAAQKLMPTKVKTAKAAVISKVMNREEAR